MSHHRAVLVLGVVLAAMGAAEAQIFDDDSWYEFGNGRSELMGYKFDGPLERGAWRTYQYARSLGSVTDCASKCGGCGQCLSSQGEDCSTWCGCGQTCVCC